MTARSANPRTQHTHSKRATAASRLHRPEGNRAPIVPVPPPAGEGWHNCPGCDSPGVPVDRLSCRTCWYRLPTNLRQWLNSAYHNKGPGTIQHRRALAACLEWFRDNPAPIHR
jgi:hypothetical protein